MNCLLYAIASGICLGPSPAVLQGQDLSLTVRLDRRAFYRGEEIPVLVVCTNSGDSAEKDVQLEASIGGLVRQEQRIASLEKGKSASFFLRFPSFALRCGNYSIAASLHTTNGNVATSNVGFTLAKRPNSDRLAVWLWPHKAFLDQLKPFDANSKKVINWWAEHGFTDLAVGEGNASSLTDVLDYILPLGLSGCLMPNGGLMSTASFEADDKEMLFQGPGTSEAKSSNLAGKKLNPFHPKVAAWHNHENELLMNRVARYPQIHSAFFNSEIVDQLTINVNELGRQRMQEVLGFGPQEAGEPKLLQKGVVADDDRGLQLHKYSFKQGNGLAVANQRTSGMVHRYRPDILTINDPFRSSALLDGFPDVDVIGSWTYTNPDPKLMLYVETLRAVCRNTGQIPLSIITLLNYPGELTPNEKDWTMMGPGRLAVTTWINLSRAPRMLGYYLSSACDPFSALEDDLKTPKTNVTEEALPPSSYAMMKRLAEEVFLPFGSVIRNCELAPRKIAVLNSDAASLFRKREPLLGYYPNMQVQHFYTVLAMAQLPADIVFDEQIERDGLDDYDVLVLPECDALSKAVYDRVLAFHDRGGLIIADQSLVPTIPDVVKFDFDFSYRKQVKALAIAKGRGFADWNDHLQPGEAKVEAVKGVSALEDQRIMESYAAKLRATLGDRVSRLVDCSEPTALVSSLHAQGGRYLVVINDKREYDKRTGKYRSELGQIVPQTAALTVNDWKNKGLIAYDLISKRELAVDRQDGAYRFNVALTDVGGTIVALYPRRLKSVEITVRKLIDRGAASHATIRLLDTEGITPRGLQPIRVRIYDANNKLNEFSDYQLLRDGLATLDFTPAINDSTGKWKIAVDELTAGLKASAEFEVTNY